MIKKIIVILVCYFAALPLFAEDTVISAMAGATAIKRLPLGPDAIVMKDAQGNDALVVFYRLHGDKQQAGFIVARTAAPDSGVLLWDEQNYVLKTSALRAGGFSPAPVLLEDRLYLFGREQKNNEGRDILYNSFANLDDLIEHTEGKSGNHPFTDLGIKGHKDFGHLSAAVVDDSILLAYYAKDKKTEKRPFSSSRCTVQSEGKLSCKAAGMSDEKYDDPTALAQATINGVTETFLMVRNQHTLMDLYQFNPFNNTWSSLYSVPNVQLPDLPVSTLELDDMLHVYYQEPDSGPHSSMVTKTAAFLSEILSSNIVWKAPDISKHRTGTSVKPIAFKGRIYVFYQRVYSADSYLEPHPASELWYFSDTVL